MSRLYLSKAKKLSRTLLPLCLLLLTSAAYAQTITLKGTNMPLKDVMEAIRKQTDYGVVSDEAVMQMAHPITIDCQRMKLDQFLTKILQDQPLDFIIENETVFLRKAPNKLAQKKPPVLTPATPVNQPMEITGRVLKKDGEPAAGASVLLQGTKTVTTTNADGRFTIYGFANQVVLISFVGYKTKGVVIGPNSKWLINLEESTSALGEVIVTGVFNKRTETFTGAATSIKREELRKYGNINLFEAIRLLDPSFKIKENNQQGSDPNTMPDFLIRGQGSFADGSSLPTFIVDGYEVSAQTVFDMDLDRVETITILKDASATILYGSRAANGVIVIETRKPQPGELRVSYNNRTSIEAPDLSSYSLMNASEKLAYELKAGVFNLTNTTDLLHLEEEKANVARGVNTDWMAQPTRNAVSQTHSFYLEGGSQTVLYGLGANYNRNSGVIKKSGRDAASLNFDMTYRNPGKFSVRNSFIYSNVNARNSPYGSFSIYAQANPYNPIYDENGNFIRSYMPFQNGASSSSFQNPLYNASLPYKNQQVSNAITDNLTLDYYLTSSLRARGSVSLNKNFSTSDQYTSPDNSGNINNTNINQRGSYTKGETIGYSYNVTGGLTYDLKFNKHIIFMGAGINLTESQNQNTSYTGTGFIDGRFDEIWFASNFLASSKPAGSEDRSRMIGLYYNANYSYDNRYFIDVSTRFDGSSKFGKDNQYAPFVALGMGWNLYKEKFFENLKWLSNLRLRGSVGTTGNQQFNSYQSRTALNYYPGILYGSAVAAAFSNYGNPSLEWQSTFKRNVGLDFDAFSRRLTLRIDYYNDKTKALILPVSVTPSMGFESYSENYGEMNNKGFEISFGVVPIRTKDFDWSLNFRGVRNRNTIGKISSSVSLLNLTNNKEYTSLPVPIYEEGESVNTIKAVRSLGINPSDGNELYRTREGKITEVWDYRDKITAGTTDPSLEGNISTNLIYKNFSLNMTFRYSIGGQTYNQTLLDRVENSNPRTNADKRVLSDRWQKPGDITFFKNIASTAPTQLTTRFVQDLDFIDIGNVSLGYRLNIPALKRAGIKNVRLQLNTNDVAYFSTVKRERGLNYPYARTFTFQTNLNF